MFYDEDKFGRKGYMEWGFMSTTSDENIAREVTRCSFFYRIVALPVHARFFL